MEAKIYDQKGKETGTIKLSERVFGLPWNGDLVHQVVTSMKANARTPVAHTKTRGEVAGGGKKPWRQKGTGRARHGSTRSPIWVGGGVAHGPRNDKDYSKKINKKMRAKALYTVLSKKLRDGELLFVDAVKLPEAKTRQAKEVIEKLGTIKGFEKMPSKKRNAVYLALGKNDEASARGFLNFGNVLVTHPRNLSLADMLDYTYVVITDPKESVATIEQKVSAAPKVEKEEKPKAAAKKKNA